VPKAPKQLQELNIKLFIIHS